jgi:hypothetical protein
MCDASRSYTFFIFSQQPNSSCFVSDIPAMTWVSDIHHQRLLQFLGPQEERSTFDLFYVTHMAWDGLQQITSMRYVHLGKTPCENVWNLKLSDSPLYHPVPSKASEHLSDCLWDPLRNGLAMAPSADKPQNPSNIQTAEMRDYFRLLKRYQQ